ncbi:large subunit ribosomal protein L29 [Methylomarinovum caldicuralii]|uniref:Large ribosomal subunit protein uL29 n=1 Tax=Methylomarinovum caldicuralii TaxID=438856 RepID=A0AAU9CRL7_9GAMM|nr:50S ribosomal protein L29 [Methylomarinovum caldicuralii]BCX80527.1 large subunit ribosomal protein L29 [Methylomarinovum caldicuralii]
MKASELRQKTKEELENLLVELHKEQFNLRMQKGTGALTKPDLLRKVRRDIARVKTILGEMARAEA